MTSPALRRSTVRLLLVDDHRVFAESLVLGLAAEPGLECVVPAHTVADAIRAAATTPVDVVLLDLELPDGEGVDAIPVLRAVRPGVEIVVLTAHPRPMLARRARTLGARGFLAKSARLEEIVQAVRTVAGGGQVLAAELEADPAPEIHLTAREAQVLRLLGQGLDANRMAGRFGISIHTTRDHIRAVLGKLGAQSQVEALARAHRLGLAPLGDGS